MQSRLLLKLYHKENSRKSAGGRGVGRVERTENISNDYRILSGNLDHRKGQGKIRGES